MAYPCLCVDDVERSVAFYTALLDLVVGADLGWYVELGPSVRSGKRRGRRRGPRPSLGATRLRPRAGWRAGERAGRRRHRLWRGGPRSTAWRSPSRAGTRTSASATSWRSTPTASSSTSSSGSRPAWRFAASWSTAGAGGGRERRGGAALDDRRGGPLGAAHGGGAPPLSRRGRARAGLGRPGHALPLLHGGRRSTTRSGSASCARPACRWRTCGRWPRAASPSTASSSASATA